MKCIVATMVGLVQVAAFAGIYGDTPDAKHAWAVHDWNRPKPHRVIPSDKCGGAPSDAIVLFDGTKESFARNWCDKDGKMSLWKLGNEGDFYCEAGFVNGGVIQTREQFGDCQLHIEYRHEPDVKSLGGPQMRGNSGVFLMGADRGYEVQVLESYYTCKEAEGTAEYVDNYTDGQAGAVYAENPPAVNPARKPGEWQVYDIVFHQPVWEGQKLVHPGSITVFFNGVLVQDHWEMEGVTTHAVRRPLIPPKSTKGPLVLQDHGCVVHYRNVWYRPIPSRWDNTTHSAMSADENKVMELRRKTAASLFGKIANPTNPTIANVLSVGEVISYANEGDYAAAWNKVCTAYSQVLDGMSDVDLGKNKSALLQMRSALLVLAKNNVISRQHGLIRRVNAIALRLGWEK